MSKLGIIGLGKVGTQVLTDVQQLNLFSEIILIDDRADVASGEALDHIHSQGLINTALQLLYICKYLRTHFS
jgi:L-lactate dehydrogenase